MACAKSDAFIMQYSFGTSSTFVAQRKTICFGVKFNIFWMVPQTEWELNNVRHDVAV